MARGLALVPVLRYPGRMHTTPDPDRLEEARATVLALVYQLDDAALLEALAVLLRPWVQPPPPRQPGGQPEGS